MLKFTKHHMETIVGIEIFPLISFVIFFLFFLGLLIWVFRADKKHIRKMAEMPLEDQINSQQQRNNHEAIDL